MNRISVAETKDKVGQRVTVYGWVNAKRNLGTKLAFVDLRDRTGLLQVLLSPNDLPAEQAELIKAVRPEWCLKIEGDIAARQEKQVNPGQVAGAVEMVARSIEVLNESALPPFEIDNEERQANEELRLKYRYLDLRHERMAKNVKLRHDVVRFAREYFWDKGFYEVETPLLTKGTPEGAREFIVPSRVHAGNFYVLPQSPQQFKQLLMVAGVEKYFQIARCFRDEDQRGDRQPEFTQMDLEMSFARQEDVMALIEEALIKLVKAVAPHKKIQQVPFPHIAYKDAMEKYGTDRPDIREDKNDPDLLAFCWVVDFPFFEKTEDGGWTFTHNPFSAAQPAFEADLMEKKNVGDIVAAQYDVVLNGFEIGGGSVRNHRPEALTKVFEIMGFGEKEIQEQFGHMLEAFSFGAPPHAGIAWGLDRIVALLAGEPNIREVIAFPKTSDAKDLMMGAPSPLPQKALDDANIRLK